MILTDTHAHLYLEKFKDDLSSVILRAAENGIKYLFLPNIDNTTVEGMLNVCKSNPQNCFPMIGLHPTSVKDDYQEQLNQMKQWLEKEKFVGIGEIGIDLYWDKTFLQEQEIVFREQLSWALQYNLPAIIHMRKSFDQIYKIIREFKNTGLRGIFHCYGGTEIQAKQILELGFKIGIGGVVTYKNSGLEKIIAELDISDLVLETDSPYLSPVPLRGKRNESANILLIAEKIAMIKNISVEEVAEKTTATALKLFKI